MRFSLYAAATLLVVCAAPALAPPAGAADGMCDGRVATIVGTPGDDELVGTAGDDVIVALAGDDRVEALAGNDLVCGGEGSDTLIGGEGADIVLGGLGGAVVRGGAGNDRITGAVMVGDDTQAVAGGPGRDFYFLRFVMQGAATLSDLSGQVDLLQGTARIEAGQQLTRMPVTGIEEIRVSRGSWTLYGSARDEVFLGGTARGARVAIFARGGRDLLAGTVRHDVLNGGPGLDTVEATPGDDRCISLERVIDGPC
jgi:Ca2+-binding RTX toxin-like protein